MEGSNMEYGRKDREHWLNYFYSLYNLFLLWPSLHRQNIWPTFEAGDFDCPKMKKSTTPPPPHPTELFHNMLVTSGYAWVEIILSCHGKITSVTHEVGQKYPCCITYHGKHGLRLQWRPCFRPGVSYIKLTGRGCCKRKNTLLGRVE